MTVFEGIFVALASVATGWLMALYWLVGRDRQQVLPVRDVLYSMRVYVLNIYLHDDYQRRFWVLVAATVVLGAAVLVTASALMGFLPMRWVGAAWALPLICLGCDLGYRSTKHKLPYQGQLGILCALWSSALALFTYLGKLPDAMPFYFVLSFILLSSAFGAWVFGKGRDRYDLSGN